MLWGLWYFHVVRAEYQTAHTHGEQLLRLAQRVQDAALLLQAHYALGFTLSYLGAMAAAREYLERGLVLYDPQQSGAHTTLYGQDPGVACLAYLGRMLWVLGYPDQALRRSYEALEA